MEAANLAELVERKPDPGWIELSLRNLGSGEALTLKRATGGGESRWDTDNVLLQITRVGSELLVKCEKYRLSSDGAYAGGI